jgi:hypothetical protein
MDPLTLLGLAFLLGGKSPQRGSTPEAQRVRDLESRIPPATAPPYIPGPRWDMPPRPAPRPAIAPAPRPRPEAAARAPEAPPPPARPEAPPPARAAAEPDALLRRANQRQAQSWIPDLIQAGASPAEAEALARWIGIESSGNPLAVSRLGERGLLQIMRTTALVDKVLTPAEWEAMASHATGRREHARIAWKQYQSHIRRALRWVANPPAPGSTDWMFYGKMNHARPMDLKEGKLHGPAAQMARDLAERWAGSPERTRRVNAAAIVAFGRPADRAVT